MTRDHASPAPDLSLICSTIGPLDRLEPLVRSVERASANVRIQLVVVDQSGESGNLPPADSPNLDVEVLTTDRGLSKGRNAGLEKVRGGIVAFPDDDAWYPDGLLDRVVSRLHDEQDLDGLVVRQVGRSDGGPNVLRYPAVGCLVDRQNALLTGISSGIFLRRRITVLVGRFDERLGVGAPTPWSAGEELDYLVRADDVGARIWFDPDAWVVHPVPDLEPDHELRKHRGYGRGIGHVLRRHGFAVGYPARLVGRRVVKTALLGIRGRPHEALVASMWALGLMEGFATAPGPDGALAGSDAAPAEGR